MPLLIHKIFNSYDNQDSRSSEYRSLKPLNTFNPSPNSDGSTDQNWNTPANCCERFIHISPRYYALTPKFRLRLRVASLGPGKPL